MTTNYDDRDLDAGAATKCAEKKNLAADCHEALFSHLPRFKLSFAHKNLPEGLDLHCTILTRAVMNMSNTISATTSLGCVMRDEGMCCTTLH